MNDQVLGLGDGVTAAVIRRGELRPGDLLVLSCPGMLTDRSYSRLVSQIGQELGQGVKVIVLEDGITVDAILSRQG